MAAVFLVMVASARDWNLFLQGQHAPQREARGEISGRVTLPGKKVCHDSRLVEGMQVVDRVLGEADEGVLEGRVLKIEERRPPLTLPEKISRLIIAVREDQWQPCCG